MYDPATGVTFDGVSADGTVNHNSGAESTIHGLLTMEALDAAPDVARLARESGRITYRDGQRLVEAESATLSGAAQVVTPPSAWTGESQWSGGAYVRTAPGGGLSWRLPADGQPRLVQPVADLVDGGAGELAFASGGSGLGVLRYGSGGPQGASPTPGALTPVTLPYPLPAGADRITATGSGGPGALDALLVQPLVCELVTGDGGHGVALLAGAATSARTADVPVPGTGTATVTSYDAAGRTRQVRVAATGTVPAVVLPGGFTIVTR